MRGDVRGMNPALNLDPAVKSILFAFAFPPSVEARRGLMRPEPVYYLPSFVWFVQQQPLVSFSDIQVFVVAVLRDNGAVRLAAQGCLGVQHRTDQFSFSLYMWPEIRIKIGVARAGQPLQAPTRKGPARPLRVRSRLKNHARRNNERWHARYQHDRRGPARLGYKFRRAARRADN